MVLLDIVAAILHAKCKSHHGSAYRRRSMLKLTGSPSGRHFLQIPGPTNVPDRVLRAIDNPTIDHRGPQFGALGRKVLAEIKLIFKTKGPVVIYPASGTGAWEAALVNTLSPGGPALRSELGHCPAQGA